MGAARVLKFQVPKRSNSTCLVQTKVIGDEQIRYLFKAFDSPKTEKEYRNRALFLVMISTGLRAKEIVNLKFSDRIETFDGTVGYRYIRKGGAMLITIPSTEAIEAVEAYHTFLGIEPDYFFLTCLSNIHKERGPMTTRSLQRIINSWGVKRADGKQASPHCFRHTVGQKAFIKGGSIAAQKILGHSSPVVSSKFYTLPYYDGRELLQW